MQGDNVAVLNAEQDPRNSVTGNAAADFPKSAAKGPAAYSSDREHSFHAMVNSAWRGQLETGVLRQVFTIRQGSLRALPGCGGFSGFGFPCIGYERRAV